MSGKFVGAPPSTASVLRPMASRYVLFADGNRIGSATEITVDGQDTVIVSMKGLELNAAAFESIDSDAKSDLTIKSMGPLLDLFDKLRRELLDRGWQPEFAEDIAAASLKSQIIDLMKEATK